LISDHLCLKSIDTFRVLPTLSRLSDFSKPAVQLNQGGLSTRWSSIPSRSQKIGKQAPDKLAAHGVNTHDNGRFANVGGHSR
jgi:hypothetical protein